MSFGRVKTVPGQTLAKTLTFFPHCPAGKLPLSKPWRRRRRLRPEAIRRRRRPGILPGLLAAGACTRRCGRRHQSASGDVTVPATRPKSTATGGPRPSSPDAAKLHPGKPFRVRVCLFLLFFFFLLSFLSRRIYKPRTLL